MNFSFPFGGDLFIKNCIKCILLACLVTWCRPTDLLIRDSINLFMSVCFSVYGGVDLNCKTNNTLHHTSEISVDQLIVRRGQPFTLSLKLMQPFDPDLHPLFITAMTGRSFIKVFVLNSFSTTMLRSAAP